MVGDQKHTGVDEASLFDPLTERETTILRKIAHGYSNQEIAHACSLALSTVKWYNKRIFGKLGVRSRTEATARARSLKLLDEPDLPPTMTPNSPDLPRNNLPQQVTSFVGRQYEILDIIRLLEKSRLLTLTGPAGSGKTRLALKVATISLKSYEDGVYFIPLAPISEAEGIFWAIAEQIGVQFHQQRTPLEQLLGYLKDKQLLLVLDNFEHLLRGVNLIAEVLQGVSGVKILVTSRERLNLYGELNYSIEGMALSGQRDISQQRSESVELFMQRAMAVEPNLRVEINEYKHIERICQLVDGLPLGIELAATWVDALSLQDIANEVEHSLDILAAELHGVSRWQTSMRAAIGRSWELLNADQQSAFQRLSIFRGGFTRNAAESIAEVNLRTLQTLVSKSLLYFSPDSKRYGMHDLVRQYAQEQLEHSGDLDAISVSYATYFASFMAERWPQLKGNNQHVALREIEVDIENVRSAWRFWLEQRDVAKLQQFLHSFWVVYDIRAWYPAGIELFERGIAVMREVATDASYAVLGWLLAAQGSFCAAGGIPSTGSFTPDWIAAKGFYSGTSFLAGVRRGFTLAVEGLSLLRQIDAPHDAMLIIPLISMCVTACQLGKEEEVFQAAQDLLTIASDIQDKWAVAKARQFLAIRAIENGEYQLAEQQARDAFDILEACGDKWSKSVICIEVLGMLATTVRDLESARYWMIAGLEAAEKIGFEYSIQTAHWQLGFVAVLQEDYALAGQHWHKAQGIAHGVLLGQSLIGYGGSKDLAGWGGRKLLEHSEVELTSTVNGNR
ncbi:MAG: hypothetical protein CL610_06640 [Anaerolineaceae bacterium]|nr:hypothetical protein [Anaerolineaceae bacterium]